MIRTLQTLEIQELLKTHYHGHLACSQDGQPYVVPVSYVWTEQGIVGYTHEGKKIEILRKNPLVCLQVEEVQPKAWKSVVVNGTYQELSGAEKAEAIAALGKYVSNEKIVPPFIQADIITATTPSSGKQPVIYRINIAEMTGRAFGEQGDDE